MEALEYGFFQRALAAGLLASVIAGIVGSLVVVRRMASISGGLAHAAFGGVGLGYLLGVPPLFAASIFGAVCGAGVAVAERRARGSLDTLVAVMWSLGMALGILFISLAPGYAPDLLSTLFGNILFVPPDYLWFLAALDAVVLLVTALLFPQLRAVTFDEEYAEVVGLRAAALHLLLFVLVSLAVVALIRVVGVILAIALLTVPAAVARQWSDTLGRMMALAAAVAALCTVGGLFAALALGSTAGVDVPTGPLIILLAVAIHGGSTLLARIRERGTSPGPVPRGKIGGGGAS
jgi:zinc transport system permease protein